MEKIVARITEFVLISYYSYASQAVKAIITHNIEKLGDLINSAKLR
ncbi:MAG: hypothetical protein MRQ13_03925 [Candidatus Midichloria sp.]|nr:hypothetical protein [Candidatus Midichloria sp.]